MSSASSDAAVLLFGDQQPSRSLHDLPNAPADDIDAAAGSYRRLIVVGGDAELAAVLTRLMRIDSLDTEVAFVAQRRSPACRVYRLPTGWRAARRARLGSARRVPLVRDDMGVALVGSATWRGADEQLLYGEAVVDDTTLFDGEVPGVRIEPIGATPGLRAAVLSSRGRPGRWLTGRAAQLGTTGAVIERDGIRADRVAQRSTFYRHTQGWLLVR